MKVIIIAAGVGSRLGDLTKNLPKPLLDVNGKSILEHQIELFRKFGIEDIVIVTGHKKESSFDRYVQAQRPPKHKEIYKIYGDLS